MATPRLCSGPATRREFLRAGTLGLGGLTLADVMRLKAQASETGRLKSQRDDTSVIFVWLPGGPPHLDMYDLKPDAPAEYRGELKPISTVAPGVSVSELLPLHAKCADKFNLVRSIAHDFADHGGGHKRFLTGRVPRTPVDTVNDSPMAGCVTAKCREHKSIGLPNYLSLVDNGRQGPDVFAFGAAYLGSSYTAFEVPGDPLAQNFSIPNISPIAEVSGRLDDRARLLQSFDKFRREADQTGGMHSIDQFNAKALSMLTSDAARKAFDLSLEAPETRARYGQHVWGARALMARRLVEAGVSFVTILMENPYQSGVPSLKQGTYNWDSHSVNCHIYDDLRVRLPIYDQAVTALIEDIYARGLDKKVMLVVTGEFGRTPRLESQIGTQTGVHQPGRDHWPQSMSMLISGGGMQTGQVVGSTNAKGEHPKDRPLTPSDLWATVYRHLGIDPEWSFPDHRGRPMPILPFGSPISELLPS